LFDFFEAGGFLKMALQVAMKEVLSFWHKESKFCFNLLETRKQQTPSNSYLCPHGRIVTAN
jgi:hypothetical protein